MHPAIQESRTIGVARSGRIDHFLYRRRFLHMLFARAHDDRALVRAGHDEQVVVVANGFESVVEVVGSHQDINLVFIRYDDMNTVADCFRERFLVAFDAK